jgi:hypothetical protein
MERPRRRAAGAPGERVEGPSGSSARGSEASSETSSEASSDASSSSGDDEAEGALRERELAALRGELDARRRAAAALQAQFVALEAARAALRGEERELGARILGVQRFGASAGARRERRERRAARKEAREADKSAVERAAEQRAKHDEQVELCEAALAAQAARVSAGGAPRGAALQLRFLAPDDPRRGEEHRVLLASYPRSGNSLLRAVVERLTGVYTGSDSDPRRPLNQQLVDAGMLGEGFVDGRVFAIKTHFPERLGRCQVRAPRAILVVRNPFDAIVSYFNMVVTETHTETVEDHEFLRLASMWDAFLREETEVWKQFHQHWLAKAVASKVVVKVVRYEDLVAHRRESYEAIARFLLREEQHGPAGAGLQRAIDLALGTDQHELGIYTPRSVAAAQAAAAAADANNATSANAAAQAAATVGGEATASRAAASEGAALPPAAPAPALTAAEASAFLPLPASTLKSLRFFSEEQQNYILSSARSELVEFGYWKAFFEASHGPAQPNRKLNSCLMLKAGDESNPRTRDLHFCVLNTRFGLRQITKDDPFGRGFGLRWKEQVEMLPPARKATASRPTPPAT